MDQTPIRDLQEQNRNFLLHPFTDHIEWRDVGTRIVLQEEGSTLARAATDRTNGQRINKIAADLIVEAEPV